MEGDPANFVIPKLQWSSDGEVWESVTISTPKAPEIETYNTITELAPGENVYIKADGTNAYFYKFSGSETSIQTTFYFEGAGKVAASGNIMSLLNSNQELKRIPTECCFNALFDNCEALTSAPELPATTLVNGCYRFMFRNCTSLTSAPELPASRLESNCYSSMFQGCTSLTIPPELKAKNLEAFCYNAMFMDCTNLRTAPALPATILKLECYGFMFKNCTSLETAPVLPAPTLTDWCYDSMFYGCSKLSSIEVAFDKWTENATKDWVKGVSANGVFKCPANLATERGIDYIPSTWVRQ